MMKMRLAGTTVSGLMYEGNLHRGRTPSSQPAVKFATEGLCQTAGPVRQWALPESEIELPARAR
jgi:hypothetical protein